MRSMSSPRTYRPHHRRGPSLRRRLLPRLLAVLAIMGGFLTAPLSTSAAHAGPPACQACDSLMSTLNQLVTEIRVSPSPEDVIAIAAQAVGEVTDCVNGNNTGCNRDLQQLQQLIDTVKTDAVQCATAAPGTPCATIVTDAQTIEQQIINTSGTCLQDSASVCGAVIADAKVVLADAEAVANACLALAPGSTCQTAATAAEAALTTVRNAVDDCLADAASTCQNTVQAAIAAVSAAESRAEALLSPPSDGGGTTPHLDIRDFQVTTQGAGEQQMVYDALQNQYDTAYNVVDAPVSNVYELPVVPKQVTDSVDSAGNLVGGTTTPEMQLIVAQTGQDFKVASVHSEDGALVGFTVSAKSLAPIGMPVTTYQAMRAAGVGAPTGDASGKWYKDTDSKCFDDSSYAWTKTMCAQWQIQDTDDDANYHLQFQYWAAGHATDGYEVDKFWIEAVPDTKDTPGMRFDGAVEPTESYDGTGSGCKSKNSEVNVTIGSGSPVTVGFTQGTTINSCEQYDPMTYNDTSSHGHYAFEWHGNPSASTQRYLKINLAMKCGVNTNGDEFDLWFGQEKA
ncbi:MAG: hypothetical protein QOD07_3202 [Frankiaceae bacterium]|nr:hypothetical protein [Frankiaceae bacterium]